MIGAWRRLVTAHTFQVQGCISIGAFSTSAVPVAAGSMDDSFLEGSQTGLVQTRLCI